MAKEFYGYFDSTVTDERVYQSDEFAEAFRALGGTGVGKGLTVSPAGGMNIAVSPGAAMIHGYTYALMDDGGEPKTFTLAGSGSADRIDRVVLRLDLSANGRNILMAVLQGVPAPSPAPPALSRTGLIREISLCQIRVRAAVSAVTEEDIADERLDAEVCGLPVPDELQLANLEGRMDARYPSKEELERVGGETLLKADVENSLNQTEAGKALDARQGAALGQRLSAVEAGKAETKTFTATFAASGWAQQADGSYTQTAAVSGITADMEPICDVTLSATLATAKGEFRAYSLVGRMATGANSVTATCFEGKPAVSFSIKLKVVK